MSRVPTLPIVHTTSPFRSWHPGYARDVRSIWATTQFLLPALSTFPHWSTLLASMPLPLEVLADLQLAVDGENVDIQADGDRIVVDLPSLRAGKRIAEAEPIARWRQASSDRTRKVLNLVGLTLEIQLQGESIAVIGAEAEPSRLGRLLRLEDVELRPAQTLRQVARQRPFAVIGVLGGLFALVGWIVARLLSSE